MFSVYFKLLWAHRDSNPDELNAQRILSPLRLPIPPCARLLIDDLEFVPGRIK